MFMELSRNCRIRTAEVGLSDSKVKGWCRTCRTKRAGVESHLVIQKCRGGVGLSDSKNKERSQI